MNQKQTRNKVRKTQVQDPKKGSLAKTFSKKLRTHLAKCVSAYNQAREA
ncbi:unnamed protein product [marine sediment metagenome]|uniref:Uncharacterized protein n=1 Tax=marine sediment metagenome TaxID=412755 RepID=X1HDF2_9ZZZZ